VINGAMVRRNLLPVAAINCILLCTSTCFAAFCSTSNNQSRLAGPSNLRHRHLSQRCQCPSSPGLAFTAYAALPFRHQNIIREKRGFLLAHPDDDNTDVDGGSQYPTGMRDRVRRGVSKASKKVQQLVSIGNAPQVREIVSMSGSPIAEVLTDAAMNAAEIASQEVRTAALEVLRRDTSRNGDSGSMEYQAQLEADAQVAMDSISLAKTSVADAFEAAELALTAAEEEIQRVRAELDRAKRDSTLGLAVAEKAASEAALKARRATENAVDLALKEEKVSEIESIPSTNDSSETKDEEEDALNGSWSDFNITSLSYEDVDYTLTDMSPPFIGEDECLVPGEPVVRVEKAPQNSRRIFAGIDIPVSVDDVWGLLTDYENLQKVVPNLVVNEVLELYTGSTGTVQMESIDETMSDTDQCKTLANQMKGAVLRQVGGAKVVGINFSARTTLEVREWPDGMPDFAHYEDEVYEGKSRSVRVRESKGRELTRYAFPRPFALSSLPVKDISMQSIENDDGEFRMYQGVWRMQPLPGCSPPGGSAMRLTYAVEVSPRPYLPVALVEGRIAQDLCSNLKAIRGLFA